MSVMLQNSFSLSNLSCNVNNANGWYGGSGDGGILAVSRGQTRQRGRGNSLVVVTVWQQKCGSTATAASWWMQW
jgi:hypothetical protein